MLDLELRRSQDDRRRYDLAGVGMLRLEGLFSRSASADAGGATLRFARVGVLGRRSAATDAGGAVVGTFEQAGFHRGGRIEWAGRALRLRPASAWRERYALADGDDELAVLDGRGWGRRPVAVTVADLETIEPGLLLFAAFVVRGLAEDAGSAAAGASVAATGG